MGSRQGGVAPVRFDRATRVTFRDDEKQKRTGRVTAVKPQKRRVKTDDGRLLVVPVRRLKPAKDEVLLLETRLDHNLRSRRGDGRFFEEFFATHGIPCLYERVHSKDELRYFLSWARRTSSNVRWVHYLGHGNLREGRGKCELNLTAGQLLLPEDADVFAGLSGKTLILSCCCVGGCPGAVEQLRQVSGAEAVFAYNGEVYDEQTRMGDTALYELMLNEPWLKPTTVAKRVNDILWLLGMRFRGRRELLRVVSQ